MAVAWLVAAVIMAITIIGLPWARAAVNIASYTFLPFGRVALARDEVAGAEDLGTGPLGVLGNLIWLVLAGWWLALGHVITAVALAVTIIGHAVRLGASEARRAVAVADRADDRQRRGGGGAARPRSLSRGSHWRVVRGMVVPR